MPSKPIIVWFRHDLRLADHGALSAAVAADVAVIPIYVLDDEVAGAWRPGAASRWWLHKSLEALAGDIGKAGGTLILRRGGTEAILRALARETGAAAVHCSRSYEPWAVRLEHQLRDGLAVDGVELKRFAGTLIHEPDRLRTKSGGPYQVFTPFWRAVQAQCETGSPLPAVKRFQGVEGRIKTDALSSWRLLPRRPDWAGGLRAEWVPGEAGAKARLGTFLDEGLAGYAANRNRPDLPGTSRLSPHLHFGEVSARQCRHAALVRAERAGGRDRGLEVFLAELGWREFSHHLLFHFPALPDAPLRPEFAALPWSRATKPLEAWQAGQTGFPIVDAGMRELWSTGWMHNRVRMIVASFLVKDLMLPWQKGEAWFWDTLVDADLAANAASWQWVAGSGADAAPYFRVFNPVLQGKKFDPDGDYVRRWVPEIAKLATAVLHAPWEASDADLGAAGVVIGTTYPRAIVDHAAARARALAAYDEIKGRRSEAGAEAEAGGD